MSFVAGDRVKESDGLFDFRIGTVTDAFYFKDADDGSTDLINPPTRHHVPVEWDNGTRGYIYASDLEYA